MNCINNSNCVKDSNGNCRCEEEALKWNSFIAEGETEQEILGTHPNLVRDYLEAKSKYTSALAAYKNAIEQVGRKNFGRNNATKQNMKMWMIELSKVIDTENYSHIAYAEQNIKWTEVVFEEGPEKFCTDNKWTIIAAIRNLKWATEEIRDWDDRHTQEAIKKGLNDLLDERKEKLQKLKEEFKRDNGWTNGSSLPF